ncbi:MAG: UvrD-helicase domain-containing protein [Bacteroidales bacterium]|nr:UvrD-helicase domain-containing protein [Bacteroidales bacterium]
MLNIYSASAGSGKTHLLTNYYLRLLLSGNVDFRKILAVTFTNKATEEMKNRIVEELYKIVAFPESSSLLRILAKNGKEASLRIQGKARFILQAILHDYSSFSVSTIDKFFQQVLRSFTREIGLNEGYTLELDTEKSLEIVIDRIYASLALKENNDLLKWLIAFSENKLEEGASWNIKRELSSLSKELFKETFRLYQNAIRKDIEDKEKLKAFGLELKKIKREFQKELLDIGKQATKIIENFGLTSGSFKGGVTRSPFRIFDYILNGYIPELKESFVRLHNNLSEWTAKNADSEIVRAVEAAYDAGLNDCVGALITLFETDFIYYNTADVIDQYFFKLALLGDISRHLSEYAQEKNLLFILDTTELLNKIVGQADAPFIYEKVGTRIDHYMIDEFQDTSNLQWQNFLPLLKESLSSHKSDLIVGDVKQSIYRFRNSDWRLLSEKVESDLNLFDIKKDNLEQNWRSKTNIVFFNNHLFGWLKEEVERSQDEKGSFENALFDVIKQAYADVNQKIPVTDGNNLGYVRLSFIENSKDSNWREEVYRRLPKDLEELQAQGAALRDIAILVRRKSEAAAVAQILLEYKRLHPESVYKYDIVSDEALKISSSKAVQLLLAAFRFIENPASDTVRFQFAIQLERLKQQKTGAADMDIDQLFHTIENKSALSGILNNTENTLYELSERLLVRFCDLFDENDKIFLQSFLDLVLDFASNNSQELSLFMEWWDKSGINKTISIPDTQEAVRVMTIHKAKGLGFKHVIIPFCDWKMDMDASKENILWCKPTVFPFNNFAFLPVKYSSKLVNTIFEKEYYEERKYVFIDSLNTLYVALTRAKEQMLIYTPVPKKSGDRFSSIANIFYGCFSCDLNEPVGEICYGEKYVNLNINDKKGENKEEKSPDLYYADKGKRLKLRLRQNPVFSKMEDKRGYGIFMHKVLSRIVTLEDIPSVVKALLESGDLNEQQAAKLSMVLNEKMTEPLVKSWFDSSLKVFSEQPVLSSLNGIKIPDRIMLDEKTNKIEVVDYKFGEVEEERYSKQIDSYCRLIDNMGFKNTKGYLWYVSLDKIVRIR